MDLNRPSDLEADSISHLPKRGVYLVVKMTVERKPGGQPVTVSYFETIFGAETSKLAATSSRLRHGMKSTAIAAALGLLVSACSFDADSMFDLGSLWPGGDDIEADSEGGLLPPPSDPSGSQPVGSTLAGPVTPGGFNASDSFGIGAPVGSGYNTSVAVTSRSMSFQQTGTSIGQRVSALQAQIVQVTSNVTSRATELEVISETVTQSAQRYHTAVAAISARLQLGTTRGNPVLVNQWNEAQADLDRVSDAVNALNTLANRVAEDSSSANFVLESARATYALSGAVDEDHRQLAIVEDETSRTIVLIDRLLTELAGDIARQAAYVSNERRNLAMLSSAIKNGSLMGIALGATTAPGPAPLAGGSNVSVAGREPLVVIRFDRPGVAYQEALYTAVNNAVGQFPTVRFDVVGVSPDAGNPAQIQIARNDTRDSAQAVFRSLLDMGLTPDRISLSSTTQRGISVNEVRLYVQ